MTPGKVWATTPSAAAAETPREAESVDGRGRAASVRVAVSAFYLAAAALVPFDDLLQGAPAGLVVSRRTPL